MKNRILLAIAIALTTVSYFYIWTDTNLLRVFIGITLLVLVWNAIINKSNWGIKIGNYILWAAAAVLLVAFILNNILPIEEYGGLSYVSIYGLITAATVQFVSGLFYIVGTFLSDKSK